MKRGKASAQLQETIAKVGGEHDLRRDTCRQDFIEYVEAILFWHDHVDNYDIRPVFEKNLCRCKRTVDRLEFYAKLSSDKTNNSGDTGLVWSSIIRSFLAIGVLAFEPVRTAPMSGKYSLKSERSCRTTQSVSCPIVHRQFQQSVILFL
jgi:hypothetical protein